MRVLGVVLAVSLVLAGCSGALRARLLVPPPPRVCPDGLPVRILTHESCLHGICGYSCLPGRWAIPSVDRLIEGEQLWLLQ